MDYNQIKDYITIASGIVGLGIVSGIYSYIRCNQITPKRKGPHVPSGRRLETEVKQ